MHKIRHSSFNSTDNSSQFFITLFVHYQHCIRQSHCPALGSFKLTQYITVSGATTNELLPKLPSSGFLPSVRT
ncbi:hypothetical protein EGR_11130 [Echinococcus granulosus]|uniref:Uncharacterized protein n=1 Tax=Echinococcus granulosus TaxID=6210 RepID=W6TZ54_ECHGR|nr:hypothetical protein EGR_11130 [Echinococcus granulosus]EUB54013.1 hypothetical protein EGR_11130 [Echinococcus granulosus]